MFYKHPEANHPVIFVLMLEKRIDQPPLRGSEHGNVKPAEHLF